MNIKFTERDMCGSALPSYKPNRINREMTVAEYIEQSIYAKCDGNDLSRVQLNAQTAQEAIGRLVDILCQKGVIGIKEVIEIAQYGVGKDEEDHQLSK